MLYFVLVEREFTLSKPNVELVFEIECSNQNLKDMKQTCRHQFVRQKRFVYEEVRIRVEPIVLEIKVNHSVHLGLSGCFKVIGIIFQSYSNY